MKKVFLVLLTSFFAIQVMYAQNVGIGTLVPAYKLTVQTPTAAGSWGLMHSDSVVQIGEYISSTGVAEFGTRTAHPLWLITGNHDNPFPAMTIDAAGINVGLGTLAPTNHLQIGDMGSSGYAGNSFAFGNGTQANVFNILTNGNAVWQSTSNLSLMPANGNGHLGINTTVPVNFLQIGDIGSSGYAGNKFAMGNGTQASVLDILSNGNSVWQSTSNLSLMPTNGNGYVGINTTAPTNLLQIGSTPGFIGNQLAIGNGTECMSFFQSTTNSGWYTNTNFSFMPAGGGSGNVGIGTLNPTYKLSVLGNIRATEIVVETGWADYVFDDDYQLPGLDSVENSIKENKHLPKMPSAKDIQENGLKLGEMQTKMMEKIEELTLYLIAANKRIVNLEKQAQLNK